MNTVDVLGSSFVIITSYVIYSVGFCSKHSKGSSFVIIASYVIYSVDFCSKQASVTT